MFNTHYVSKVFVRWVGGNLRQRLSFKIGTDSQQKKAEVSNTRPERIDSRYRFRYENYIVLCACVNKYIYIYVYNILHLVYLVHVYLIIFVHVWVDHNPLNKATFV